MKMYRVNESEVFNLDSMYHHLKAIEIDMEEGIVPFSENLFEKIEEVEGLLEKAFRPGALVDWSTLRRIREIQAERQAIRYGNCLKSGKAEDKAAIAFDL